MSDKQPDSDKFNRMINLGTCWLYGGYAAITKSDPPWTVNLLGSRGEYMFCKVAPKTGTDSNNAGDFELEQSSICVC
jgi:glutamate-1-semialdehyde 2,1-aminomutase